MLVEKMRKKNDCKCHNVTYGKMYEAVQNGAKTAEEVEKITGASTGCGKCRDFVEHLVREFVENQGSL